MLRLSLSLPELEKGTVKVDTGSRGRLMDVYWRAMHREPVAITPIVNHDHNIVSAVLLTDDPVGTVGGPIELKFRPIVSKTFTLCASTKDKLLAIIIEFEHGQFWFDESGHRKCKLTLQGNGTDPKVVDNAYYILGDMLAEDKRPYILRNVISYIQKTF